MTLAQASAPQASGADFVCLAVMDVRLTSMAAAAAEYAERHRLFQNALGSASAAAVAAAAGTEASSGSAAVLGAAPTEMEMIKSLQLQIAQEDAEAKRRKMAIADLEEENAAQLATLAELDRRTQAAKDQVAAAEARIAEYRAAADDPAPAAAAESAGSAPAPAATEEAREESPPPRLADGSYDIMVRELPSDWSPDQITRWVSDAAIAPAKAVVRAKSEPAARQMVRLSYARKDDAKTARAELDNRSLEGAVTTARFLAPARPPQ